MMNHAELHMAVRKLVAGRPWPFVISTNSVEHHVGQVTVDWGVCILIEGKSRNARGPSAEAVLEQLEDLRHILDPAVPSALAAIGDPPRATPVVE
jgi:hypothetical protein